MAFLSHDADYFQKRYVENHPLGAPDLLVEYDSDMQFAISCKPAS